MAYNEFVDYLNSLHNYDAQNSNAYSEKNISSKWYEKIAVHISLGDYIKKVIETENPQIIILTGHAGDGKTSIMYQVLKDFNIGLDITKKINDVTFDNGKICRCIKDFSELAENEKIEEMKQAFCFPSIGKFVFMVANTGPLINTFKNLFTDSKDKEKAEIELIEAIDLNQGICKDLLGYKINVINVAAIDNTFFAKKLLINFVNKELWSTCDSCEKKEYCPIYRNIKLINENKDKTISFISSHYIWLYEYGKRLTVRSMTEQLAFMITGGLSCENVKEFKSHDYLYPNLFFGYKGTNSDAKADNITAIRLAKQNAYYKKRLTADEYLFVCKDYQHTLSSNIASIIEDSEKTDGLASGWKEMIRRIFFFTNIITDKEKIEQIYGDIFSKIFTKYLELRNGKAKPGHHDFDFLIDALSMIYTGTLPTDDCIPLTLSRGNDAVQNVQLIVGEINKRKLSVVTLPSNCRFTDQTNERHILSLIYDKQDLCFELKLPILNYFYEVQKGIISTNIDPQLSHGVESLKTQLSKFCNDSDYEQDLLKIVIQKNKGNDKKNLEFNDDGKIQLQ